MRRTLPPRIELVSVDHASDCEPAREILREYAASLAVDLCFQNFEAELASLPGEYAAPGGLMLLASVDGAIAACGGFRALADADYANA